MNTNNLTKQIRICNRCLDVLPALASKIRDKDLGIRKEFGGSICLNHANEIADRANISPERRKQWLAELDKIMNHNWPPDLREHPELVKAYSQNTVTEQHVFVNRLKKLANI